MISVVEMAPADRPLLNLRGGRYRANNASDCDEREAQFPYPHAISLRPRSSANGLMGTKHMVKQESKYKNCFIG
jgi:hypothetical protein